MRAGFCTAAKEARRTEAKWIDAGMTREIIGAAMEVHRDLGPGLLRSSYVECLCHELRRRNRKFSRDCPVPLRFLGQTLSRAGCLDLLAEGFPVEALAVDEGRELHKLHLASLLRHAGIESGLLLNFNTVWLKDSIQRCFASPRSPFSAVQP